MRDLTVRGRCFLAAGAAAIICGIQIGERDFVRIGLLAAAGPAARVAAAASHRARRVGTPQRQRAPGRGRRDRPGRGRDRQRRHAHRHPAAGGGAVAGARASRQRFVVDPMAPQARRPRCATRSTPRTAAATRSGRCTCGSATRSAWSTSTRRSPRPRRSWSPRAPSRCPRIPLTGRWAGAGDDRTRDLLGGGSPDVTIREYRLGDDLRRIHWPTQRPRRRADGAPRGAAVAVALHAAHRQPADLPPRLRRRTRRWRRAVSVDRLDHAQPGRPGLRGPAGQRDRAARPRTAGTRAPRGANLPEHLERLALMRHDPARAALHRLGRRDPTTAACCWPCSATSATPTGPAGRLAAAGDSAYAVVLDVVDLGPRRAGADPPATASLRSGGWKATTLDRDGSLAPRGWSWRDDRPAAQPVGTYAPGTSATPGVPARRCWRWSPGGSRCSPGAAWWPSRSDFLIPTLIVGLAMALAGSGLRMLRVPSYVVAAVQVAGRAARPEPDLRRAGRPCSA